MAKYSKRKKTDSKFCDPEYLLSISGPRIFKDVKLEWTSEHYKFCLTQIKVVLNSIYSPLKCNILDTERAFALELVWPGLKISEDSHLTIRGIIDRIDKIDDDTIEIIDYKTGRRTDFATGQLKDFDSLKYDLQLGIYELAARKLYPSVKHRMLTIFFTADGGPFTIYFDDRDDEIIIDEIRRIYYTIANDNNPKRLKDDRERKSHQFKCKFVCEYGNKYLNCCDDYYKQYKSGTLVPLTIEKKSNDKKLDKFEKIIYDSDQNQI